MKYILILVAMFVANFAHASGKLSLQNNIYSSAKAYRPMASFAVYEKLTKNMAFNGWLGYGVMPLEVRDDVDWVVAKVQIDANAGHGFVVAPGVQYKYLPGESAEDVMPFVKITYQLW